MHDTFFVHVLEGARDLFHVCPDRGFIELQFIALFLLDEFFEVSSLCPFCDDNEFIVVDEGVDILYDVGVIQFFHDIDLPEAFFPLSLVGHVEDLSLRTGTLIFLSAKGSPC